MKIKISDLQPNTGQIDGVPSNPRTITEKDFEELKDSLTRNPDNIKKFPLVIAEHKKQLVVISGNQRLRAMQALGWTELEHVGEIYPDGTDPEILKEAVIIANTHKGEWDWDALANDGWPEDDLETWGVDMHGLNFDLDDTDEHEQTNTSIIKITSENVDAIAHLLPEIRALCEEYPVSVSVNTIT